ncbi:hypothetical protein GYMLUDRAFT_64369 [Collybiopsis luxurians FD-317 M1]|uniref:Uncharacterized protein n=1 Tax=Collybiopsis luxurians FD-317 M1 TaxID=944289 RepID=A0A0D0APQ0_9AGAR|nr:hypothetical protein GYMLUDRAFT_64369 [Collybiopsis luxurians FD-317 M1]
MSFSALEDQHKKTVFELETYKELYNWLLQTIQDAPALTSTPTTALLPIPSFQRINFPKVKLWTSQDFFEVKNGNGNCSISLKGYFPKQTGLWFLEDEFGQPLNFYMTDHVCEFTKMVWMLLREQQVKQSLPVPKNWTKANADAVNLYHHYMCHRFPFLALCDDLWKTKQIWLTDYTSCHTPCCTHHTPCCTHCLPAAPVVPATAKSSAPVVPNAAPVIPATAESSAPVVPTVAPVEPATAESSAPVVPTATPIVPATATSSKPVIPAVPVIPVTTKSSKSAVPVVPTTTEFSMPVAPTAEPVISATTESSLTAVSPTITDISKSTVIPFADPPTVADSRSAVTTSNQYPAIPASPTKVSPLQISSSFNALTCKSCRRLFDDPKLSASLQLPPASNPQALLSLITLKAPEPSSALEVPLSLSTVIEQSTKSSKSKPKPKVKQVLRIRFGDLMVGKFVTPNILS